MSDELFLEQESCMSSTTSTDDEEPKVTRTPQREFTPEKSKAAIHCGPELISYSIHFSSLCFTIVVLQLSFRGVYWADEDDWEKNRWSLGISQPVMAGLLQFAAKLHEIFILVSISTIIIDIIRRRLLISSSIPFGFLVGAYQFGSANSLFSASFWGPFTHALRHRRGAVIGLGMLIGIGGIYANAIGPASAVLIVPTLSWWPAYDLSTLMTGAGDLYPDYLDIPNVKLGSSDLYSEFKNGTELNATELVSAHCLGQRETLPYGCPGIGAMDIRNAYWYTRPQDTANRTFTQRLGKSRRDLYTSPTINFQSSQSAMHISSTVHSVVMETIGLGGRFISLLANSDLSIYKVGRPQLEATDSSTIKSPVVQTECKATRFNSASDGNNGLVYTKFPTNLLAENKDPSRGPLVPQDSSWGLLFGDTVSNFTWVDRSHLQIEGQMSDASIGAVAAIRSGIGGNLKDGMDFKVMFINCVIDARWAATQIIYDPSNSDLVLSNITDASLFNGTTFSKEMRARYGIGDPIYIKPGWADLLNAPVVNNLGQWFPAVQSYLENFPDISNVMTPATRNDLNSQFAKFISLTIADGLSRVATSPDDKLLGALWSGDKDLVTFDLDGARSPSAATNRLDGATQAVFKVRRYGWGYGVQTKTAKFAASILLIHAVIALSYMLFMFIHWSLYTVISRSWKNMDQLFALAVVSSKPPSLEGVSAGVGTWDTWKLDVALREDQESHEHLELVFGGRDGEPVGREDGKIIWRKKYN
jgi:hypothetical protein